MQTNESLPLRTRLAFGMGDLGAAIVAAVGGFFLNVFLLDVARLPPLYIGIIFFISSFWDAVNDPIIGRLSDRTRSRWGRRRPWLLFGAVPFGLAFFAQWLVPNLPTEGLFIYYLIVAILLKTAFTAVNLPYTALTPELTDDYNERTRLNAFRFAFSILGGVAAVGLQPVIVGLFKEDVKAGYMAAGMLWGVLIIISALVVFTFTRERPQSELPAEPKYGFWQGLRITLSNRPFLIATGIYLFSWLTLQFVQNNLVLFINNWLQDTTVFTPLILLLQGTAFLFLPIWARVSVRIGKKRTYMLGALIWALAMTTVWFLPRGVVAPMLVVAFFAGTGVSVAYLIPWSMLPDVVDYDELQTGERREGIYYGFFVMLQQIGLSVGLAISNFMLDGAGYVAPETVGGVVEQPESVLVVLRLFVSLIPAGILLLSLPLAQLYPLSAERHAEIRAELDARKGDSAS